MRAWYTVASRRGLWTNITTFHCNESESLAERHTLSGSYESYTSSTNGRQIHELQAAEQLSSFMQIVNPKSKTDYYAPFILTFQLRSNNS